MLSCLFLVSALTSAQSQATTTPKCEDQDRTVDAFGSEFASDARQFLIQVQNAVRSDDREVVASVMIYYPCGFTPNQEQLR